MSLRNSLLVVTTLLLAVAPLGAAEERPFKGGALSELVSFDYATASAVWEMSMSRSRREMDRILATRRP